MNIFFSIVPKLERLISLDVLLSDDHHNENYQFQLETLLKRAFHINILRLRHWSSILSMKQKLNLSLSQLDLMSCDKWYNHDECIRLNQLLSDIKCNLLLIDVKDRKCILEFVHQMNHLQTLIIRCQDDMSNYQSISNTDELLQWLRQNLPSLWIITRDYYPICYTIEYNKLFQKVN